MCTGIVETVSIAGSGKGPEGWFKLEKAHVSHDHPAEAPFDDAMLIDFVNEKLGVAARVAVELSTESALQLANAILATLSQEKKG